MFFVSPIRLFFAAALLTVVVCIAPSRSHAATKSKPATGTAGVYKGYVVIDAATGKILLEDNANLVSPPASMTKLMTFLLVDEAIRAGTLALDTAVQITTEDYGMGGTQVYLDPKETFSVEELLYALMIQSANDAATALARATAGSRDLFVEKMNARAQALGMTRTRFTSPHGLPPNTRHLGDSDLTSPADFAILCRELVTHTDVLKYSSIKKRSFGAGVRTEPLQMENHNKLLGRVAGVDGLKTGYTKSAGYCLSATAARNGRRLIVVIMGSFGSGGQADYGAARDLKTIELIERGFATLQASSAAPTPASANAPKSTIAPAVAASPISPVSPTESGPVRGNLSAPRRPHLPADVSPVSPVSPSSDEKTPPTPEEPTVKFVPIAPPIKSKTR
jgi:D-alanyl-D-alanine carboxypeptidase (penicillin-binding protein 5/6)